jgi:hypothetical protein
MPSHFRRAIRRLGAVDELTPVRQSPVIAGKLSNDLQPDPNMLRIRLADERLLSSIPANIADKPIVRNLKDIRERSSVSRLQGSEEGLEVGQLLRTHVERHQLGVTFRRSR